MSEKQEQKQNCKGCIYDGHTKGNSITVPCCHPLSDTREFWSDVADYSCKVTEKSS